MVVFGISSVGSERSLESFLLTWTTEIKKYRPDAPWILLGYDHYERMCEGFGIPKSSARAEAKILGMKFSYQIKQVPPITLYIYLYTDKQGLLHTLKTAVIPFSSKQRYGQFWIEKSEFNYIMYSRHFHLSFDLSVICHTSAPHFI